jgi:hypothetical protein
LLEALIKKSLKNIIEENKARHWPEKSMAVNSDQWGMQKLFNDKFFLHDTDF